MKTYAYDIESYINLFTITFINVEDDADEISFYVGLDKLDYSDVKSFMQNEMVLVGYNNDSYDNPMLRFLQAYTGNNLARELYNLSGRLIRDDSRQDKDIMALRYPRNIKYSWTSIDLMRILAFDKLGISLKQTAINLKHDRIQDLPIRYDATIGQHELTIILEYNRNDVIITKKLYHQITPLRALREDLSKLYGIDLLSASDSRMANLILEKIFSEELKLNISSIREKRTLRDKVLLGNCLAKFVKFETQELQDLLDRIKSTYVYNPTYKYSEKIFYAGCRFKLGVGGLHSEDDPRVFISDEKYLIQDCDVASYYPNLIINNGFYPEHLGKDFIKVLKKITQERIAAKKTGDKVKADGLKITINSIFGKLGSETFWLYDPKQMLSTTVSGQMGLLMLIEKFYLNGIEVISANTDGVVCKIDRSKLETYYKICDEWQKKTNLELEYTPYKKYVRRDVNSYITEKDDGKTKEKGAFVKEIDLKKSFHMPIVAKALYYYFIKNVPVKETIENCKDIFEFCISQKSDSKFHIELHTIQGVEHLQKTNRFFITKKGGSLLKRESFTNKTAGLYVGKLVRILNEYKPLPFEDYNVDFVFYENEVYKIIDAIEPKQINMFDMSSLDVGTKTKMTAPNASKAEEKNMLSKFELNKLGKNQFARQIKSISDSNQKVDKISPKYVYVKSYNSKSQVADLYCVRKGTCQPIKVSNKAYDKMRISEGSVIYCKKFEKRRDVWWLVDYEYVDNFTEDDDTLL